MKDMTGRPIEVGDWIVFPRMKGESPVLAFGHVTYRSAKSLTAATNDKYQPDQKGRAVTLRRPESILVVEPENVPDDVYFRESEYSA